MLLREKSEELGVQRAVVGGGGDARVMPEKHDFTAVLVHFVEESLALEEGFVFGQVHVVVGTECAVHDGEGVEGKGSEPHGFGIYEADGAGGLQTETDLVGETHGEVVRNARIGKALHLVNGATEIVTAVVSPVRNCGTESLIHIGHWQVAIVRRVQAQQCATMTEQVGNVLVITTLQVVLRVVVRAPARVLYKIDACGVGELPVLIDEPRERVGGVVVQVSQGCAHLLVLPAEDTPDSPAEVAEMLDSVHVVGEVDMTVARIGEGQFEQFHQEPRVLVHDGDKEAVVLPKYGVAGSEASVLVTVGGEEFFGTRDEEERVVNQVGMNDECIAGTFHFGVVEIGHDEVGAKVSAWHDDDTVAAPLRGVRGVADLCGGGGVAIEQEGFDVVNYLVHTWWAVALRQGAKSVKYC